MKVVILGCGRMGSNLARQLVSEGHQVTVIDNNRAAFALLGTDFPGRLVNGNGIDEDVLRNAGLGGADAFIALTNRDNTNLMAVQVVTHNFKVPRVICRLDDPAHEEIFANMGFETLCRTRWEMSQVEETLKIKDR